MAIATEVGAGGVSSLHAKADANADMHKTVDAAKVKKMKPKVPKDKKQKNVKISKATAGHPTYHEMIVEAISSLKERTGSSQPAIAKYLDVKYKAVLPDNYKKILSVQLRNLSKKEKLAKVKNSYKLSESLKKPSDAAGKAPKTKALKSDAKKVAFKKASRSPKAPKSTRLTATPKVAKSATPKFRKASPAKPLQKVATPRKVKTPKSLKLVKSPAKTPKPASVAKPSKSPAKSLRKKAVPAAKRAKKVGK